MLDADSTIVTTDQFWSNMLSFGQSMVLLKAGGLSSQHISCMQQTPFWQLFDMYNQGCVSLNKHRKSDFDIVRIIKCYDVKTGTFVFGGKHVRLTPMWVSRIFGIPCSGDIIDITGKEDTTFSHVPSSVVKRGQLQKTSTEHSISMRLNHREKPEIEKVTNLICLLICNTLFFPSTGTSIPWFIAKVLVNVDVMSK